MPSNQSFTVGWVSALSTEQVAACEALDEEYGPPEEPVAANDTNSYKLGRIGKHNVVIAVLPDGEYGTDSAASVATNMLNSFPNVRIGLMVGIGGGAPTERNDIRLGDVVVSSPGIHDGGVFEYDFGKTVQNQVFQHTRPLNLPPISLRTAVNSLKTDYERKGHRIREDIENVLANTRPKMRKKYARPDIATDRLYRSNVIHQNNGDDSCAIACGDDPANVVLRNSRDEEEDDPATHYGTIASANQLMKDAEMRDKLARERNVMCFEMEAAGLMNKFPCLVIRGVCDYSDTHKNKAWQGYAAMTSAFYAKDLLTRISPNQVEREEQIARLADNVAHVSQKMDKMTENTQLDHICKWLLGGESDDQLNSVTSAITEGTGQWFIQNEKYKQWKDGELHNLLCPGTAGVGKTVLVAIVVRDLHLARHVSQDIGIAYYFRRHQQKVAHLREHMLSSFLAQLIRQTRTVPPQVLKLYHQLHPHGRQASRTELTIALFEVAKLFKRVHVVVDALDEWPHEELHGSDFTDSILNGQRQARNVFLLMTSRPEAPLLERLRHSMQTHSEIHITATNDDIERYLMENLAEIHCLNNDDQNTRRHIISKVTSAADGSFFLARLHCHSLKDVANRVQLNKKVDQLQRGPDALNEAYRETFERIGTQSSGRRSLAASVLHCIHGAFRLLRSKELIYAVSMTPGDAAIDEGKLVSVPHILSVCHGLVTYQEETDTVDFTHRTIADYLQSSQHVWLDEKKNCIGNACLTYLQMDDVKKPIESQKALLERIRAHQFLIYAALFVGFHVRYADCEKLHEQFENMLADDAVVNLIPQIIHRNAHVRRHRLHVLAFFGLERAMFKVLQGTSADAFDAQVETFLRRKGLPVERATGVDVDVEDEAGRTPLYGACSQGPAPCVQVLLDFGADVDSYNGKHGTPLQAALLRGGSANAIVPVMRKMHTASPWDVPYGTIDTPPTPRIPQEAFTCDGMSRFLEREEHELRSFLGDDGYDAVRAIPRDCMSDGTVQTLLKSGALVNIKAGFWGSPLNTAIASQRSDLVQILLGKGADVNKSAGSVGEPLRMALDLANLSMVRKFVERGPATDAMFRLGGRALGKGSLEEHLKIVQLLLEEGADADSQDHLNIAVLQTASREKFEDMDTYFKHIVDANATGMQRQIALAGVDCPDADIGKLLLEHLLEQGANVNIQSDDGTTPLHRAACGGKIDVSRMLLAHGADKALADDEGDTAVHMAAVRGYADTVKLFVDDGCDLEKRNNNSETALIRACAGGSEATVKVLMDGGADKNAKSNTGTTGLAYCARRDDPETTELLLSQGAEIHAQTKAGNDALMIASKKGHVRMVQLLLRHEANVHQRNEAGNTALHKAIKGRHDEVAQLLLGRRADVDARNNKGETPLMQATENGHNEAVQLLLDRGAQANVRNNDGETPLLHAASHALVDIAQMLVKKGADVNAKDPVGSAPLARACTNSVTQMVATLVENGAHINLRNGDDDSPLRVAKRMGHARVAKYLAEQGAVDAGKGLSSKYEAVRMSAKRRIGI